MSERFFSPVPIFIFFRNSIDYVFVLLTVALTVAEGTYSPHWVATGNGGYCKLRGSCARTNSHNFQSLHLTQAILGLVIQSEHVILPWCLISCRSYTRAPVMPTVTKDSQVFNFVSSINTLFVALLLFIVARRVPGFSHNHSPADRRTAQTVT